MLRLALFFFATSFSSSSKSRAIERACFLFKFIFDYTWFQHNFKGYRSILLHVDERFYIYGATDKISSVWMKNAARGPRALTANVAFQLTNYIKITLQYECSLLSAHVFIRTSEHKCLCVYCNIKYIFSWEI